MKGYSVLNINKLVLKLFIGAPVCIVVLSVETSVQTETMKLVLVGEVQVTEYCVDIFVSKNRCF